MRFIRMLAALAVALALLAAVGCGAKAEVSIGTGSSPSPTTNTYRSDQYRFSLQYDSSLTQNGDLGVGVGGGSAQTRVGFVDKAGAIIDKQYVDLMWVSVHTLSQSVTPDQIGSLKSQFQGITDTLVKQVQSTDAQPLTQTTVNGKPALTTNFTASWSGTPVKTQIYFLVNGTFWYQVSMQATASDWAAKQPVLQRSVDSFTLL
jgi:hypothetical protein